MNKKAILWVFAIVVSFILSVVPLSYSRERIQKQSAQRSIAGQSGFRDAAQTTSGDVFLTPSELLSNNPEHPDLDTWLVRCTQSTRICADVADVGFFGDNTFHVSIVCVNPGSRRGRGNLEYAIAPEKNPSDAACVNNCQVALVLFQCEFNDSCDDAYNSLLSCGGDASFAPGFPKRRDRDQ